KDPEARAHVYYLAGVIYFNREQYETAARMFTQVKQTPDTALQIEAGLKQADCHYNLGNYGRAYKAYESVAEKYPNSRLVDDAKLRIAEFYNIWGTAGSDDLLERKTRAPENWRKEANRWLLDVVENHPDDKAVSYPKTEETGEYTASYALYFLYAWGAPKDKKYLEMLVQKYPASEAAGWAKEILSRK
ncbi:MAG: tetratricopeptide repeat protein, partial [Patescibacteria group bacterium]